MKKYFKYVLHKLKIATPALILLALLCQFIGCAQRFEPIVWPRKYCPIFITTKPYNTVLQGALESMIPCHTQGKTPYKLVVAYIPNTTNIKKDGQYVFKKNTTTTYHFELYQNNRAINIQKDYQFFAKTFSPYYHSDQPFSLDSQVTAHFTEIIYAFMMQLYLHHINLQHHHDVNLQRQSH